MGAPLVREKKGSVVGVVALGKREESYKPESGQPLAPGRYRRHVGRVRGLYMDETEVKMGRKRRMSRRGGKSSDMPLLQRDWRNACDKKVVSCISRWGHGTNRL